LLVYLNKIERTDLQRRAKNPCGFTVFDDGEVVGAIDVCGLDSVVGYWTSAGVFKLVLIVVVP